MFTSPSVSSFFFFLSATGIFFALLKLQIKNCSRFSPVEHLVPHQLLHQVNGLLPVLQPQLRTLFRLFHWPRRVLKFRWMQRGWNYETTFMRASSALPAEKYWTTCVCANLVLFTGTFFFSQETTDFWSFVICSSSWWADIIIIWYWQGTFSPQMTIIQVFISCEPMVLLSHQLLNPPVWFS